MSIVIKELSKIYNGKPAVDGISFEARKGEILGFLGPNGAGKSTTMKILTGFIPATSGSVTVNEIDVFHQPLKVKQMVGYLPEHNPLYLDMYVREYLNFIAGVHQVRDRRQRIDEMIDVCGLEIEKSKKIGSLSKGYRQRVGLAQTLIHDPEVLILDEPTTGLDPNQIIEIRELIRSIAENKTLVFSTHILSEVKELCDRVVIINKGRIVTDEKVDSLLDTYSGVRVEIEFSSEVNPELLRDLVGVKSVEIISPTTFQITTTGNDIREELFSFANENGTPLIGLNKVESSLEDIFKKLTRE